MNSIAKEKEAKAKAGKTTQPDRRGTSGLFGIQIVNHPAPVYHGAVG